MSTVRQKTLEIISRNLDIDIEKIRDEQRIIEDLGADSLALLDLILEIEEQFETDVSDEAAEKHPTVGAIVAALEAEMMRRGIGR